MRSPKFARVAFVVSALACGMLSSAGAPHAASFLEFVDPNPAPGNQFGGSVLALSTGNVVITARFDDAGGTDAGAVYLFDGATGALISTLLGSAGDQIGFNGVVALANGNFLVISPNWHNGTAANAGAVTWGSGTTGVSGVVTAANSLVGSTAGDNVGSSVVALTNGNYVVRSPSWDSGAIVDAGAVTWGSGTSGVSGTISAANSLVGSTASDQVGAGGVAPLTNGNYVVRCPTWDSGTFVDAGAVTWGSGTSGVSGTISAANSLVGSQASDGVGTSVVALTNGNYVVTSTSWDNGAINSAGAVTWGNGTSGVIGTISAANSLVGSTANDAIGTAVVALTNGNYVVRSTTWDNGAVNSAGAATWGNGLSGVSGVISAANSLVGSQASDQVGSNVVALTNGNYVVTSQFWDNGAVVNVGAATWGSGTSGVIGTVSAANSLVGSTAGDNVGAVTALTNGNYVVNSTSWDNGAVSNAGAVTWGSGASGVSGVVSAANSLVGSTASDQIGSAGVATLANGNYVVRSPAWDNGAINSAGAATWGSGTTGVSGAISVANSLVGSTASDQVGVGVVALTNGSYVVRSPNWDNGGIINAGAATWGSGTSGVSGTISAANSLIGSSAADAVGGNAVTPLTNGNYVVVSPTWHNGGIGDAGAATWGSGTSGVSGTISAANSLVGSTVANQVGNGGVTVLSDGNYVVASLFWDDGVITDVGAATWGSGTSGVSGAVSTGNSLTGAVTNAGLLAQIIEDGVNGNFFVRFAGEGGGRVRVGPQSPQIVSAVDIPNDQGGWLRLTFDRSFLDYANGSPPVTTYGAWRHVPGTLIAHASGPNLSAGRDARPDTRGQAQLRALLPTSVDTREVDGRLYAIGVGPPSAEAAAFPPGTWELVMSIPALQHAQYVVAVPTISNLAPNDFVVTAHTTIPSQWYISGMTSAQSVDNLAPSTPNLFAGAYASGQTNLTWAANSENDIGSYRVYRGTSAGFTPGPGNLIATVPAPGHSDPGPAGRYYKVSAVDVNGNESGFALLTPDGTADVAEEGPVAFALEGVRPNPASGHSLHVAFALPHRAAARLELLDVSGRRVVAREVGSLGAGHHSVNLAEGHHVAPGLYWVRLVQEANRRMARVAVIE